MIKDVPLSWIVPFTVNMSISYNIFLRGQSVQDEFFISQMNVHMALVIVKIGYLRVWTFIIGIYGVYHCEIVQFAVAMKENNDHFQFSFLIAWSLDIRTPSTICCGFVS